MQYAPSLPASPPHSICCPKTKQKDKSTLHPGFLSVGTTIIHTQAVDGGGGLIGFNSIQLNLIKVRENKLIAETILAWFFQPLIPINIAWHHRPCCTQASWGIRLRLFLTHMGTYTALQTHSFRHMRTHTQTNTRTPNPRPCGPHHLQTHPN